MVATAEIDILFILVSGIYVTAVVVFPSSKVVSNCENIYPIKQSIPYKMKYIKTSIIGGKKAGEIPDFDAGQQVRQEGGRFSIWRDFLSS